MGALIAAMGGVDALVFTAGIGQHAAPIRERICQAYAWLGAALDTTANTQGQEQLHLPTSTLNILMIPTDEERMIGLHTLRIMLERSVERQSAV
jgi:acetate kinase